MKMRAPGSCVGVSYRGRHYAISEDGSVEIDEEACAALEGHGFVCSTDVCVVEKPRLESKTDRIETEDEEHSGDTIECLNRAALFAFLRSKGVSVSLPITNRELRRRARLASDG